MQEKRLDAEEQMDLLRCVRATLIRIMTNLRVFTGGRLPRHAGPIVTKAPVFTLQE